MLWTWGINELLVVRLLILCMDGFVCAVKETGIIRIYARAVIEKRKTETRNNKCKTDTIN